MQKYLMQRYFRHIRSATALFAVLAVGTPSLIAQDRDSQSDNQRSADQSQRQGEGSANQRGQNVQLPQSLKQLDLSQEQESEIKSTISEHNQKLMQTWEDFHRQHARAIELEAAWAVAVRDTLSPEDQSAFDRRRMEDRQNQAHRSDRQSDRSSQPQERRYDERQSSENQQGQQGQQDRDQSARRRSDSDRSQNASDAQASNQRDSNQRDSNQRTATRSGQRQAGQSGDSGQPSQGLLIITFTSPEPYIGDAQQSSEQKQKCEEACQKFRQELTSVWQELHDLHLQLVQIESEKMKAVEEALTDEQMAQLRESRSQPSSETASVDASQRR